MAWVKLDDHFDQHPKIAAVGPLGIALWVAGLAYCNRNMTDGFIPWSVARSLLSWQFLGEDTDKGRKLYTISVTCGYSGGDLDSQFVIDLLVEAGLWDHLDDGYMVHDYDKYQPSRVEVQEVNEAKRAQRVAAGKSRAAKSKRSINGSFQRPASETPGDQPATTQRDTQRPVSETPSDQPATTQRDSQRDTQRSASPDPDPDPDPKNDTKSVSFLPRARAQGGASLFAGQNAHRMHAACFRVCVPAFIHDEFIRKLPVEHDVGDRQLREWYLQIDEEWLGKPIGDRPEKFWRTRFEEWQGTTQKQIQRGPPDTWFPKEIRDNPEALKAAIEAERAMTSKAKS